MVGLKNAGSLNSTTPGEQAVFSLAANFDGAASKTRSALRRLGYA
jgi:hypothetical protein